MKTTVLTIELTWEQTQRTGIDAYRRSEAVDEGEVSDDNSNLAKEATDVVGEKKGAGLPKPRNK